MASDTSTIDGGPLLGGRQASDEADTPAAADGDAARMIWDESKLL
jgi:hypothetical protein